MAPSAITSAIGPNRPHTDADARTVQKLLKSVASFYGDPRLDPGPIDGIPGTGTFSAIERFQRMFMHRPDAVVDPGGRTIRRLLAQTAIADAAKNCRFPYDHIPNWDYHTGMRAFGSRRSGGKRAHAGVDLYAAKGTPIHAMADGTVTRAEYYFYNSTYAVEVDHGAFLARYGEIKKGSCKLAVGAGVTMGHKIAEVGHLTGLTLPSDMLHFEIYDKTERGKLTRARGTSAIHTNRKPFLRRKDLMDATPLLDACRGRLAE